MLAYAANAPRHAERRSSPNALLAVIAVHVAVIAAVMSAKMDLPQRIFHPPTTLINVPLPTDPPPVSRPHARPTPQPRPHGIDRTTPIAEPTPSQDPGPGPASLDPGAITGVGAVVMPHAVDPPRLPSGKLAPQLLTPPSELKPPYPHEKLLSEEEALLKLRLTIDERGRVIAVEPIGRADPVFLNAARRYLLAHWLYRPASEDGRTVASSTVITLRFTLEG
jgi:protein TonB